MIYNMQEEGVPHLECIPVKKAKSNDNICEIRISLAHKLKELLPFHCEVPSLLHDTINFSKLLNHIIDLLK